MSQDARKFVATLGLLAVCSLIALPLAAQKSPVPQAIPVNVQNTPNVTVSNTANVNVTNTPSVNVTNTPSVNVTNSPTVTLEAGASVNVTNLADGSGNPTPLSTLDAVQLYGSTCEINFAGSSGGTCNYTAIPQGKELYVQEFDAAGALETGTKPVFIGFGPTIATADFFTAAYMGGVNGLDVFATHQETRLYVVPGTTPECAVYLTANSNQTYDCQVSGFLIDVPSGSDNVVAPQRKPLTLPFAHLGSGRQNNSGR